MKYSYSDWNHRQGTIPVNWQPKDYVDLPWYENVSEIFGHLVWFWSIEIIRRDLRNRITHEPDPEIPLGSNR